MTGKILPTTIHSLSSEMTIRFTSDHKKTKKGFQIKIEYVLTGKKMAITMTVNALTL